MRTKTLHVAAAALLACIGCTSRTVSNTPRTAIEQLLLSGAVDRALAKFDVPELSGKKLQTIVVQRAPFPTGQHELLVGEVLLEPTMDRRLLEVVRQPVAHVVAVAADRPHRTHPEEGHHEDRNQHDLEASAGVKRLAHTTTGWLLVNP